MVSSLSYKLASRVTGFGVHRKHATACGRGYVRKVVGAVSRPALTYIANKIADVISGTGRKRRAVRKPRTVRGSSWRPSGMGMRKPRKTLGTRKRRTTVGTGTRRKPRASLTRRVRRIAF